MSTQSATIQPSAPVVALGKEIKEKLTREATEELYVLRYKKGAVSQSLNFWWTGGKEAATAQARKYCDAHKLRFIWCEEFAVDILSVPAID